MTDYMHLSLDEIEKKIIENEKILKKIWDTDDGSSYDKYCEKCQPYWNDCNDLYAAKSLKIPYDEIELRQFENIDRECRVSIKDFTEWCRSGCVSNYDGVGYYATEDKVSWLIASTYAFRNNMIRPDFKYVCWYNK